MVMSICAIEPEPTFTLLFKLLNTYKYHPGEHLIYCLNSFAQSFLLDL